MPTLPNDVLARIIGMLMDDAQAGTSLEALFPRLALTDAWRSLPH
jgi:hypothetical protein